MSFGQDLLALVATIRRVVVQGDQDRMEAFVLASQRALLEGDGELNRCYASCAYHALRGDGLLALASVVEADRIRKRRVQEAGDGQRSQAV